MLTTNIRTFGPAVSKRLVAAVLSFSHDWIVATVTTTILLLLLILQLLSLLLGWLDAATLYGKKWSRGGS